MNSTHRARRHLEAAGRDHPQAWTQFDDFRQRREALGGWPEYVFCPLAGAYAVASGGGSNRLPLDRVGEVARLGALAAWRPTQGIYRFDPDLYAALVASPPSGQLPCEVLRHMPAWCVYLESSEAAQQAGLFGFFAHMESDTNTGGEELRLLLDHTDGLLALPLHLGPWDLSTALDEMGREARKQAVLAGQPAPGNMAQLATLAGPLVSLLLYLCSDGADYERAGPVTPTRTKKGLRLFPPHQPRTWEVGTRIGAALRRAASLPASDLGPADPGTRASPRPHVRTAHWHLYWTGPRTGTQVPKVRWIAPVGVNLALGEDLPAVVRQVSPP